MRPLHALLAVVASAIPVSSAAADILVLGTSAARICYEAAAREGPPRPGEITVCTEALASPTTTLRDIIATHVNRGILHLRSGRIDEALRDFDRATALDPDEPEAYFNRGTALMKRAQAAGALSAFDEALRKRTQRPALAHFARAVAHEDLGNVRAAYHDYLRASQLAPEWEVPRNELRRFRVGGRPAQPN